MTPRRREAIDPVSTLASLLAGIPDDPLTAQVVADYLEEQADPRGEVLVLVDGLTRGARIRGRKGMEARLRKLLYGRKVVPITPTLELELGRRVTVRFAWVPPGAFCMGSPETEDGASDAEQPAHDVT